MEVHLLLVILALSGSLGMAQTWECASRGGACRASAKKGCVRLQGKCENDQVCCQKGSCECGVANDVRIIGGEEISPPNKYPWLVGLLQSETVEDGFSCGGSIISPNYVLTAAHCLFDEDDLAIPAEELQVGIANHNFNSEDDDIPGVTQVVDVESYITHEDYIHGELSDFNNDIALIHLKETLDLTSYPQVRPVCLPSDPNTKYEGQTGTVVGWGDTKNGKGAYPDAAREVNLPIKDCTGELGGDPIIPQIMCAGKEKSKNKGAKGICFGDSGGPLFVKEDGKYTQVGIVSHVVESCLTPGVFTRVTEFLTWISDNTPGETFCR
ncbi:venom protease-like [Penaeus vannamei]|uniref:venom protease-like n=1 Tax=Penaeus vannamei TaxID=6689 RepID=UPI00387F4CE8